MMRSILATLSIAAATMAAGPTASADTAVSGNVMNKWYDTYSGNIYYLVEQGSTFQWIQALLTPMESLVPISESHAECLKGLLAAGGSKNFEFTSLANHPYWPGTVVFHAGSYAKLNQGASGPQINLGSVTGWLTAATLIPEGDAWYGFLEVDLGSGKKAKVDLLRQDLYGFGKAKESQVALLYSMSKDPALFFNNLWAGDSNYFVFFSSSSVW